MEKDRVYQQILLTFFLYFFLSLTANVYALVFNIVPNGPLPQTIFQGTQVTASYIVRNNTRVPRMHNFVKYLPPFVEFISGSCFTNFNLAARGQEGDSCTLDLLISGPVNARDPNPHHHLFVCLQGGTACAGTEFPLHVALLHANPFFVAVGSSYDAQGGIFPLAYYSKDGGRHWLLPAPLAMSADAEEIELNGVSCVGESCMLVGSYESIATGDLIAFAFTSANAGASWTPTAAFPPPPGDVDAIDLSGIACNNNQCTAAGTYFETSTPAILPLAYRSQNNGKGWTLANTFPLPSEFIQGMLAGITCVGTHCTAIGSYSPDFVTFLPWAYTSNNGGIDWTLSSGLQLPSNQAVAVLNGVTCVGGRCIAVGVAAQAFFASPLPLVYLSNNGGASWSQPALLPLAEGQDEGFLGGVSCLDQHCIAVGDTNNLSGPLLPVAYISRDAGRSWTPVLLPLPIGQVDGSLSSISCMGGVCTAVGTTLDFAFNNLPIAYFTTDGGRTWQQSAPLALPAGQIGGFLSSVSGGNAQLPLHKDLSINAKRLKLHRQHRLARFLL